MIHHKKSRLHVLGRRYEIFHYKRNPQESRIHLQMRNLRNPSYDVQKSDSEILYTYI